MKKQINYKVSGEEWNNAKDKAFSKLVKKAKVDGFREGKDCHQAILEINHHIMFDKVNYVVDADIKGFFDNLDHNWLIKFLEHDIADKNFIRYIKRFLIGGVMEDGKKLESDKGTPQGGLISPVLANVHLHYTLDTWFDYVKKHEFKGEM